MLYTQVGADQAGSRDDMDVAMSRYRIWQYDAMAHRVNVAYMGHRGLDRSEEKQHRYTSENGRVYGTKDVSDT